jgi:hypothetical protein
VGAPSLRVFTKIDKNNVRIVGSDLLQVKLDFEVPNRKKTVYHTTVHTTSTNMIMMMMT